MKIITTILKFVIKNLYSLHNGLGSEKIISAVKLATVPAVFVTVSEGISKWYIVNQWFMVFVFCAIAIDHLLGSIVHAFYKRDFTFKKNLSGIIIKIGSCIAGYMMFTMMHEIIKDVDFISMYFKTLLQLTVFIYPAGSALGNLSILTGGKFPPIGWMKIIAKFQENLDLENFKTKKDENENINSYYFFDISWL